MPLLAHNPMDAAVEGVRLIRREPKSVLAWMALWLAYFVATAIVVAMGRPVDLHVRAGHTGLAALGERSGPIAPLFVIVFLTLWACTTLAAYRAVLRPKDRAFFFLRLGADEIRLALLTFVSALLVVIFGGAPAYLLLVLFSPFMQALPSLARSIATVGAVATFAVDVWLGVRLSLIAVETFAERRFHLTAYWPLAKGRFWYLLAVYVVCFLILFGVGLAFSTVIGLVMGLAQPDLEVRGLLRRTSLLGLAATLAVLASSFVVICSTLICASQAFAFREIVGDGQSDVAIA